MPESEEKKATCAKENSKAALIAAGITLASSTGLLGLFGIFSGEHSERSVAGVNLPATRQFITKDTREKVVELRGEWKFRTGDDLNWAAAGFDDGDWGLVSVPMNWDEQGYQDYDGFAWYRRSFRIGMEDTSKPLFLFLGKIDDVDEVFVNGVQVGGRGRLYPDYLTAWNQNRIYRIDAGILDPGAENVIAVRVYDDQLGGGIVSGPVGIYASQLPQPLIDLAGEWLFRRGDDLRWTEEEPADSVRVQVPLLWEANGFEMHDGYAWYHKRFGPIPARAGESLALVLGKIDDTDQVFLNGELIGSTGKLDGYDRERNPDFWKRGRVYEFPARLLSENNLIAVRVHDSGGGGGIYSGPVGIMRPEDVSLGEVIEESARGMTWGDVWDWMLGHGDDR